METLQHKRVVVLNQELESQNLNFIQQFLNWCETRQDYSMSFLVGMFLIHGNLTVPATLLTMHFSAAGEYQVIVSLIATFSILISNLTLFPTRITIPIFLLASVTMWGLVISNVLHLLNFIG